jgi:hypothetical protein
MKHILFLDEVSLFALIRNDLQCLAFEVMNDSYVSRHFNRSRRMAGDK